MSELKPCPFCGGEAELHEYDNQFSEVVYIISCSKCNCKMELNHNSRLVDIWNTRTQSQCELYDELYKAALGLSHGIDWNNGTQAIEHGYRDKLINAVNKIKAVPTKVGGK